MPNKEEILEVIYKSIDSLNYTLPETERLEKSPQTPLFGKDSSIDSIVLLSLIVETENHIKDQFGVNITLTDERAMHYRATPFKTVSTFCDHVIDLMDSSAHAK